MKKVFIFFLNYFSFVSLLDVVYFMVLTVSHIVFMIKKERRMNTKITEELQY